METGLARRTFLGAAGAAGAAVVAGLAAAAEAPAQPVAGGIKIIGVSCSPRQGKTTAAALEVALNAAKAVGPNVEVELIDLAGLNIPGCVAAGLPVPAGQQDDFLKVAPKLADPKVAGLIVGSPVYFGTMSSLAKAFIERLMAFRQRDFALSNKVAGALAVGGARNGGQELVVQSIETALLCQEMIVVGDGRPGGRFGATLWSQNNDITGDEFGLASARNLGRRVAEVALRLAAR